MWYVIVENECAINMISVMLQYMICKSIQYREQFSSQMKIFIWMSVHDERDEYQWTALAWSSVMFICINKLTWNT